VVLESDKATMDVPSTLTGTVKEFIAKEGDKLATGDQVALIEVTSAAQAVVEAPAATPVEPAKAADPACANSSSSSSCDCGASSSV